MVNEQVGSFASRLVSRVEDQIESIVFYQHPFNNGGLIIMPRDIVTFIPDLVSEVYECEAPPLMFHFLRRSELFQLSFAGVFGWPNPLEEKPHLAFWVKNRGVVLYGSDIRDEIMLPSDTSSFLQTHAQRCKQFVRNWALDQLRRKNYRGMVKELERQTKYLMATALLSKNEWDFSLDEIPQRFDRMLNNTEATRIWAELSAQSAQVSEMDDTGSIQSAFESLWFFEQFLSQMERCAR